MSKNNWSSIRNTQVRKRIKELRRGGIRPSEIYERIGKEFGLSESRVKQIEYNVQAT